MMTTSEIDMIRTILQDEVNRAEWELSNDVTLEKTWSMYYMSKAKIALEVFNREYPSGS